MDKDEVIIISVSVFGTDSEQELKDFAEKHDWKHALGDPNGDIEIAYEVAGTPRYSLSIKMDK